MVYFGPSNSNRQMTKNWCNRLPPSVQALGPNNMTEVCCKNSITRHRRGSQRERNIRSTKALEDKTLRRRDLKVRQVSFMSEYLCYKRRGRHTYARRDKVQRIMCLVNKELNYIVHASMNMRQIDRKSTRLNSSHLTASRMPSSA